MIQTESLTAINGQKSPNQASSDIATQIKHTLFSEIGENGSIQR